MVEVDRERSMKDRMAGREGRATSIRIRLGDRTLELVAQTRAARGDRRPRGAGRGDQPPGDQCRRMDPIAGPVPRHSWRPRAQTPGWRSPSSSGESERSGRRRSPAELWRSLTRDLDPAPGLAGGGRVARPAASFERRDHGLAVLHVDIAAVLELRPHLLDRDPDAPDRPQLSRVGYERVGDLVSGWITASWRRRMAAVSSGSDTTVAAPSSWTAA